MTPMEIIEPARWEELRPTLPKPEFLLDLLVPAHSKTLLHGPPGCGKSSLAWGIGNAVSRGAPYLDVATRMTRVLLISNDMSLHGFNLRWEAHFRPNFAFCIMQKANIFHSAFRSSEPYKIVKDYCTDKEIGLVMIDALGGIHAGKSARDDETATMVDAALSEWLGDRALLLLAHDRKIRVDTDGNPVAPSSEDFMGSQIWRANAASQLHMYRIGNHKSIVSHEKSQVSRLREEKLVVYIDLHGMAEPWDEHRMQDVKDKWGGAIAALGLAQATPGAQVAAVATHCNISERTAWRWRTLVK